MNGQEKSGNNNMANDAYKCNGCGEEFSIPVTMCNRCRKKEAEQRERDRDFDSRWRRDPEDYEDKDDWNW